MKSDPESAPKNVLPELIIPLVAFLFTIYYLTTIVDVPWIAQASAFTVSGLLLLSILAFAIRTFMRVRRGSESISLTAIRDEFGVNRAITRQRIVLLALTISYLLVLPLAGFTLSTFCLIFTGIVTLSSLSNWPRAGLLALLCSIIAYVVFIHLFKTRLPFGPVETLLKGLL